MDVFFVSRNGHQEGPHSIELIEDKIRSGYLTPHDYIYDAKINEWTMLSQSSVTKEICAGLAIKEEITKPIELELGENTWYLLRDNNQSGPFEVREIVEMLQEKKAFEYDYVWSPSLTAWERISECSFFQPEKIKPFLNAKKTSHSQHFRRRLARVEYGASLVLHNNKKVWNGTGFEVSGGGASVEVPLQSFEKGEVLIVHYRPSKHVPAFNVHCEVMSCVKIKDDNKVDKYRLGLRFIRVNNSSQQVLRQIVAPKAA